jgi:PQQ-dependent catabolism-associated CXXCW motif protein
MTAAFSSQWVARNARPMTGSLGSGSHQENASKQGTGAPFRFNRNGTRAAFCLALIATIFAAAGTRAADVPEPESYRLEDYRAPTPATLRGAKVIGTEEAEKLWRSHTASFVDVLPRPPRPRNLPAGTLWRDKPRPNIPGSIWLPDTGYGELAPSMAGYFAKGLEKATRGDRARLLVLYCLADCWMSWNAAKRAQEIGYSNVAWYPEGTDGWLAAGLPLEEAVPEPRPDE